MVDNRRLMAEALARKRSEPRPGQFSPGPNYQGQLGSPDLPSARDNAILNNSGDAGWKAYIDNFGLARELNPTGPVPGMIPMPRPRMPDMQVGGSPLGDEQLSPLAGTLRTQDVRRNLEDAPYETVEDVQKGNSRGAQGQGGNYAEEMHTNEPDERGRTDEDMLDEVSNQMGEGGMDQGWEGSPENPTQGDVKRAMANPSLYDSFVDHFTMSPEDALADNPEWGQGQ